MKPEVKVVFIQPNMAYHLFIVEALRILSKTNLWIWRIFDRRVQSHGTIQTKEIIIYPGYNKKH